MLAKQTEVALSMGDRTVKSNELVARSFEAAAEQAGAASDKTIAAFERQGAVILGGAKEQAGAYAETADAAKASAEVQTVALDEASVAAIRAGNTHVAAAKKVESAFGSSGSTITKFGKYISLGLIGAAAASVDLAVKFQASTLRMQTQAGATSAQLKLLRAGILDMAGQVGDTPDQLSTGMYHVVSSMNAVLPPTKRVSTELAVLKAAAQGAKIGGSDLEDTTYALASAMNALHAPGTDAKHIMGELNAIVGAGDMTMQDLVDSFKSGLIPAARQSGVSLQSMGAAEAVMGDMGMRGAMAGTRLRMAIALLSSPSEVAAKVLTTLGMKSAQATSTSHAMADALQKAGLRTTSLSADLHKPDGILVALQDLDSHLRSSGLTASGAAAVMSKAFGGARTGATITLLAQNTDRLGLKFTQIGKTANQFGSDWSRTADTTKVELDRMGAGAVALGVKLGDDLLPDVNVAIHDITEFVDWIGKGGVAVDALGAVVATFAAVSIGSYFTSKIKGALTLMKDFKSAMTWTAGKLGLGSGTGTTAGKQAAANDPLIGALDRVQVGLGELTAALDRQAALTGEKGIGQGATALGLPPMGEKSGTGPFSIANPGIVSILAGEYAGLSSEGAAGTVSTEQHVAQAETGAVEAEGGAAAVRGGTAAAESTAVTGAEELAPVGLMASLKSGLPEIMGNAMKGGLVAIGGNMAAHLLGGLVGGKAGKDIGSVGGDAATGAGIGMLAGPEGAAIGAAGGALVGLGKSVFGGESASDGLQKLDADIKQAASSGNVSLLQKLGDQATAAGNKLNSAGLSGGGAFLTLGKQVQTAVANASNSLSGPLSQALTQVSAYGFPQVTAAMNSTSMTVQQKSAAVVAALEQIASQGTGPMAQNAKTALDGLRSTMTTDLGTMTSQTVSSMAAIKMQIEDGSQSAAASAATNLGKFESAVSGAMNSGVVSTQTGMKDIGAALNAYLVAVGEPKISFTSVSASPGAGGASLSTLKAQGKATGGLVQFGQPGQRGKDTIPANVGGVPIAVGAGEQAAVFTRQQQSVVNGALAAQGYNGLGGLFGSVRAKHYMAGGGFVPGAGGAETYAQLEGLWDQAGGPKNMAPLMAAIAEAESSGNPNASNPSGASGLWQILGAPFPGNVFDPLTNARMAVAKYQSQGLGAWVTYTSGAYKQFLHGNVAPGAGAGAASITAPLVKGAFAPEVQGALNQAAKGANAVIAALAPAGGVSMIPGGLRSQTAPKNAAPALAAMFAEANAIASHSYNYEWGGGHGTIGVPNHGVGHGSGPGVGFDCSGAVSAVLHAGNLLGTPEVASWFMSYGDPGLGKQVSIFASPSHVFMEMMGHYFGTSTAENPGGGANWIPSFPETMPAVRHPPGMAGGGWVLDPKTLSPDDRARLESNPYATLAGMAGGGFPDKVIKPSTVKPKIPKGPKGNKTLSSKDTQELSTVGGKVSALIARGNSLSTEYSALQSRFSAVEGEPLYAGTDGTPTSAGYSLQYADEQKLIDNLKEQLTVYKEEAPLVSGALRKFLGKQSKTDSTLTGNLAQIAENKLKATSIRTAILDLSKPQSNRVQTLEQAIASGTLKYGHLVTAAENAKSRYRGKDTTTKDALADAVLQARENEETALSPLKSALLSARTAEQSRAQSIKAKDFSLRSQLNALTVKDTKLATQDTTLKSILAGAGSADGSATGIDPTISALEAAAANLGTIDWKDGIFSSLDIRDPSQGLVYTTETDIISANNTLQGILQAQSGAATTDDSQLVELLEEQNLQLSETLSLNQAQTSVLAGMIPEIPQFAAGGPVLADGLAYVHQGEHVVPQGGTLVSHSAPPQVTIEHHYHGNAGSIMSLIDQRIVHPDNVKALSKEFGRRTQLLKR